MLLAGLVVLTLSLSSCATRGEVALFPIEDNDIYYDGDNICMTPYYFNEVLQAKIKNVNVK